MFIYECNIKYVIYMCLSNNNVIYIIIALILYNNEKYIYYNNIIIIIYHDFLPTERRGSHVKSDKTHTQSSRYAP